MHPQDSFGSREQNQSTQSAAAMKQFEDIGKVAGLAGFDPRATFREQYQAACAQKIESAQPRTPEVEEWLNRIAGTLQALEDISGMHIQRLKFISRLGTDGAKETTSSPKVALVPLADALRNFDERVKLVARNLNNATQALEIP